MPDTAQIPTIGNPNGVWGEPATLVGVVLDPSTQADAGYYAYRKDAASRIQPGLGVGVRSLDDFARSDRNLSGDISLSGRAYGTFGNASLPILSGGVYRINQARAAGGSSFITLDHGFQPITRMRAEAIFYPALGGPLLGTSRAVLSASRHSYTRVDPAGVSTSGSATVLDPAIKATDYGSAVGGGANWPAQTFCHNIVPGVSFDLCDLSGTPVLATGSANPLNVSITSPTLAKASVQAWISQTQYGLFYNDFGLQHDILGPLNFPFPLAADGITPYPFEASIDLVNSIVTCTFPQVGRISVTNAEFAKRWENYIGWQLDPLLNDYGDVGMVSLSASGPTIPELGQQLPIAVGTTGNPTTVLAATTWAPLSGAPSLTLPNDGNIYRVSMNIAAFSASATGVFRVAITTGTPNTVGMYAGNTINITSTAQGFGGGEISAMQVVGAGQTITIYGFSTPGATITCYNDNGVAPASYGPWTLSALLVGWGTGSP